jgi:hypothetical protein
MKILATLSLGFAVSAVAQNVMLMNRIGPSVSDLYVANPNGSVVSVTEAVQWNALPSGAKARRLFQSMYGLKPVPFRERRRTAGAIMKPKSWP